MLNENAENIYGPLLQEVRQITESNSAKPEIKFTIFFCIVVRFSS